MPIGKWSVKDYDTAAVWLSEGRKKWERPLYIRSLRVMKSGKDTISIFDKWGNFAPVLYHSDGSVTIQVPGMTNAWGRWNPLRSQTVRRNILELSGIKNIYQKNYECYIVFQDAIKTPAKIQGCRSCKKTGRASTWCYDRSCYDSIPCAKHPEAVARSVHSNWHSVPCEHGILGGHEIPDSRDCYYCKGAGTRDYGSKDVAMLWDGSALRLKDGSLIKQPPTELEKRIAAYVNLDS